MHKLLMCVLRCCFIPCNWKGGAESTFSPGKMNFLSGVQSVTGVASDIYGLGENIATYGDRKKLLEQQGELGALQIKSMESQIKEAKKSRQRLSNIRNMLLRGTY